MPISATNLHDLFNNQLRTYEKVVSLNLMDHQPVYELLRNELQSSAPPGFVFLDLACGPARASAQALAGLPIGRYFGVDVSEASLSLADHHLAKLSCPRDLRCGDFAEALRDWNEPVDIVWIGMSLHHLSRDEKTAFMRRVSEVLPRSGLFLIWEPTLLQDEDRQGWLERFHAERRNWAALSDEEFAAFLTHMAASDFPESSADWLEMGRSAGFESCDEIYVMRNKMGRVFRYRHE